MYFTLNANMKMVAGINRYVCHSLLDGKIYFFDAIHKNIIAELLHKKSLAELKEKYDEKDIDNVQKFLIEKHIGFFESSKTTYVSTIKKSPFKNSVERMKKFSIDSIMIRLNGDCNLNCSYCTKRNDIIKVPCMCFKSLEKENVYVYESIDQAQKLGVRQIELIGGEPFLHKDKVFQILDSYKNAPLHFVIYTNGIHLNKNDIIRLRERKVYIILRVFTFRKEYEYQITGTNGYEYSIKEKMKLLDLLNLNYHVEFVINKYTEKELKDPFIIKLIQQNKLQTKYALPSAKDSLSYEKPLKIKIRNSIIWLENYEQAENTNLCFRKGSFIDADGSIYPCIGLTHSTYKWRNMKNGLYKVYQAEKHKKFWNMSNENDPECKNCAERLMCINCKAYKIQSSNNEFKCCDKQ